jgi:ABC-type nitrate/sulfonate/bicarbonate transport system substrate-binding protein
MSTRLRLLMIVSFVLFLATPLHAQKLNIGWSAVSALNAPFWVINGASFLKEEGLVTIGAVTNAVAFYVMANPSISSVADLKGRKVGVTRFGASTDFAVRKLLEKYHLRPITDVPIVQIGGMPEIAAALSNVPLRPRRCLTRSPTLRKKTA